MSSWHIAQCGLVADRIFLKVKRKEIFTLGHPRHKRSFGKNIQA
jgi:hypothetical protein